MLFAVPLDWAVNTEPTITLAGCQAPEPPTEDSPRTNDPGDELGEGDELGVELYEILP